MEKTYLCSKKQIHMNNFSIRNIETRLEVRTCEPFLIKWIIEEMFRGDCVLGIGYRKYKATYADAR